MALSVSIVADSKFPINRKRVRGALNSALKNYGINLEANVSVAVVGTRKMAELNKKYLKREGPTDVLAFPQQSNERGDQGFITSDETALELGDIVICYPLALEQAARLGIIVDERVEQLALHGFGNLIGKSE